jgi:hypothetical protein
MLPNGEIEAMLRFIIDELWLVVDELWSDVDETSKRRVSRVRAMLSQLSLPIIILHISLSHIITPSLNYSDDLSIFYVSSCNKYQQSTELHSNNIRNKIGPIFIINKIGCNLLHNFGIYNYL